MRHLLCRPSNHAFALDFDADRMRTNRFDRFNEKNLIERDQAIDSRVISSEVTRTSPDWFTKLASQSFDLDFSFF